MSKLISRNAAYFRLLLDTTSSVQKKLLIKSITTDQLKALVEIVVNLLSGTLSINPKDKYKLKKRRQLIRQIADTRITLRKKKKLLFHHQRLFTLVLHSVKRSLRQRLS